MDKNNVYNVDFKQFKDYKKKYKGRIWIAVIILAVIIASIIINNIYLEVIQLKEIGDLQSIFLKNLSYKIIFFFLYLIFIFLFVFIENKFISKNLSNYYSKTSFKQSSVPNTLIAVIISVLGALISNSNMYIKALTFFNSTASGTTDPIFSKDISYYMFERPFLISLYGFLSGLMLFMVIYTALYYLISLSATLGSLKLSDLKINSIITHNLINISVYFFIKIFSFKFSKEGILFSSVLNHTGAGYVEDKVWLKYYNIMPFILIAIVILSFFFIKKKRYKHAGITIAVYPAIFIIVSIIAGIVQGLIVSPNEKEMEQPYLMNNIEMTRKAYNLDNITEEEFTSTEVLTPEIIENNIKTVENIRVLDYESTLKSNVQLQSLTLFYTFNDGDIIDYDINQKKTPVFISAREVDTSLLPERSYINERYRYTHGNGIVMNPINTINSRGQVQFLISGLDNKSSYSNLNISRPEIYYGELTYNYAIVNANGINEIDKDGSTETRYEGNGGIKLTFMNRILFAVKYQDFKLITSSYAKNATLLPNRQIVKRAAQAVPFLFVDNDPYIVLTDDGRLKWVLDAYTLSDSYPYSEYYSGRNFNYIRNSVKIVIDAYDGKVEYYIIDKDDPIIRTYSNIYPGIFKDEPLPEDIQRHMKYPEELFKVQTEMLKAYHLTKDQVGEFYSQNDLWNIAKYPSNKNTGSVVDIDPYYILTKLPGISDDEELALIRPFTPSSEQRHNMVAWLTVRNSIENYGEMVLYNFPKSSNVFGPNQVEVQINQDSEISKNMTLWGQSGSEVYKGSLLVIPIQNSFLYVEPIYIRAAGTSSIPEIRKIVVGYQKEDQFIYAVGDNLKLALNNLFENYVIATEDETDTDQDNIDTGQTEIINDLLDKYNLIKEQLDEIGKLIEQLQQ